MHLEILVEEFSMKRALDILVPKIIGDLHSFTVHDFRSKGDLLSKLESRLRGYNKQRTGWDFRIVVLVDEDRQDCSKLKEKMNQIASNTGVADITLNRIVVEELEAWYFGDIPALRKAYPKIPESIGSQSKYRDPDHITGGTWEALDRLLVQSGYHKGLLKSEAAEKIAAFMDPWNNTSKSFQVFRDGVLRMINGNPI